MRTGPRRHLVVIQRRVNTPDEAGQPVISWVDYASVWAEALPLRGRELLAAQQVQSEVTTMFRIRYRADLDDTMRVLWDNVPYGIAAPPIDVEGRRIRTELMCARTAREGV